MGGAVSGGFRERLDALLPSAIEVAVAARGWMVFPGGHLGGCVRDQASGSFQADKAAATPSPGGGR